MEVLGQVTSMCRKERKAGYAEPRLARALKAKGLRVTKRGWPDFFVLDPKTGGVCAVEVKHGPDEPVSEHQRFVLSALAALGVPTYVWTPGRGLRKVKARPGIIPGDLETGCQEWDDDHKRKFPTSKSGVATP